MPVTFRFSLFVFTLVMTSISMAEDFKNKINAPDLVNLPAPQKDHRLSAVEIQNLLANGNVLSTSLSEEGATTILMQHNDRLSSCKISELVMSCWWVTYR